MSMDIFLRRDLGIFIASQRILKLIYYILSIRLPYYLLLKFFLERIIIVRFYKRTMILNIPLEKLRSGEMNIILRRFLGHHRVLI